MNRDEQFAGFAALLIPEIDEQLGSVIKWAEAHDASEKEIAREINARYGKVITQRAYDFACHVAKQVHEADGSAMDCGLRTPEQIVSELNDMRQWPEETSK